MTAATRGQPDRGDKTAGRRRASRARPTGTNGTAAAEHTAGAGEEDKRREGRKGGERGADGHAPGEWRRGTRRSTAAGREQRENEKKRYINI